MAPTVGFDLDMTLIDSRPGIRACYLALAEHTGTYVDADLAVTRLGPPLEQELANWFPADAVPRTADLYRTLYPTHAITGTTALPGAREAVAAVRDAGGRTLVVTAKYEPNAKLHLDHLGIEPDAVIGNLWAEQKAVALKEHAADIYVGDHLGDIRGARAADAYSVAVASGPYTAAELEAAGADTVLNDLTEFPAWLKTYRAA
ncbi:haloacid dehalogenase-like hydrolase [Streptomyces sp. NPDC003717]|uniref:HAD family hydrolase n=1 Tax=Streptomyces sp. NPDC003717 TaxID=3154276 RepID=UPI0033A38640